MTRLLLFGAALCAMASPLDAQVLTRHELSAALQLALAQEAIAACRAQDYQVTVAIAARDGTIRLLVADDGADAASVESTRRKAHTAGRLGFPTSVLTAAQREAPAYVDFLRSSDPEIILLGGGVPIRAHGEVVGAIGIGGTPRPQSDEACANAALTRLADRLS
jgi:uncharacterized protein GlcG (DUF336 family)